MNLVWGLRKAGLSLLTGCKGRAKPVTGIEDVTVSPSKLPEYVDALESVFKPLNLKVCYYGHAASGCLHIRPVLDLRNEEDRKIFRNITDEVAKIVKQFKGSLASEHGVGIARTEYLESQVGKELVEIMRQIKAHLILRTYLTPVRLLMNGRLKIDTNLRLGNGYEIKLPFEPVLNSGKKMNHL
jgi:FAD/FMN-containing dehydrogenase